MILNYYFLNLKMGVGRNDTYKNCARRAIVCPRICPKNCSWTWLIHCQGIIINGLVAQKFAYPSDRLCPLSDNACRNHRHYDTYLYLPFDNKKKHNQFEYIYVRI